MNPLTVLIVDDEPDMRLYLRSCLQGLNLEIGRVLEAPDGLEALRQVRSGAVDVVITDVVLPRMDGYTLCRAIKNDPELQHVAVLVISGEDGGPSVDVGADGFLEKPFNTRRLHGVLETLPLCPPGAPPELLE